MQIAMIGAGYVGLVTGACFSEFGANVTCVDQDIDKILVLNKGQIPIFEPGLEDLVRTNVQAKRLTFTSDLKAAVEKADAVFIAVGTPSRRGDGHADLSFVFAAAKEIASSLNGYTLIVTKSTVPVGTGRQVVEIIREIRPTADFDVCSNPEFLREGNALHDNLYPSRIIVGDNSNNGRDIAKLFQEGAKKENIDIVEAADWTGITAFMKFNCPLILRLHGSDTYFCHLEKRKLKIKARRGKLFKKALTCISILEEPSTFRYNNYYSLN